ncbi:MAG: UDP-galactopyranose mutase [Candidatus Levyibacteriota bacterium]
MAYDIIIVGAGISGATLAQRYATLLNKKVLILEKRDHIGGNCYDNLNEDGILVSKYGAHLFHTNFEDVWEYVNKFSQWTPYEHRVLSSVDGKLVPVPVNITTVNALLGLHIASEDEMKHWLEENTQKFENPKNSEEMGLSRVGPVLYEKLFKHYTQKQWNKEPKELAASVIGRIPVRTNFEDRYFTDIHQAIPKDGYTKLFENLLNHPNITIKLSTDYFKVKETLKDYEKLFFTGPIDQFYAYKYGKKLQYRSIRFEFETFDQEFYQSNSVINYPNEHAYTRIVEYKHFTGQKHTKTTISKEFPTWEGEPYYPVPSKENLELFALYQKEAEKSEKENIFFVGRLANYKYFNMDQAFKNALDLFERLQKHK